MGIFKLFVIHSHCFTLMGCSLMCSWKGLYLQGDSERGLSTGADFRWLRGHGGELVGNFQNKFLKTDSKRVINYLGLNELRRRAIIFIQTLDWKRQVADIDGGDCLCPRGQIKTSYFTLALAEIKDNAISCISQTIAKVGNLWDLGKRLFQARRKPSWLLAWTGRCNHSWEWIHQQCCLRGRGLCLTRFTLKQTVSLKLQPERFSKTKQNQNTTKGSMKSFENH